MKELNIYQRLVEFQKEVGKVTKGSVNPHFRSKFADINAVLETIMPVLNKHGIAVTQLPTMDNGMQILHTKLFNIDKPEEFIEAKTPMIMTKNDAQAYGSSLTYCRRYSLVSMLNLEIGRAHV